ncbi:MAG: hypothetical protein LBI60_06700 [Bacteroidales bacterium]|jgi:DNA repair ATPase RecN|nr:hypothetical protein [Bacteroidales bacterium]
MTGENKVVLKIFALYRNIDLGNLDLTIKMCHDALNRQDVMQLINMKIPAYKLATKENVLNYILNEVESLTPKVQEKRSLQKALKRLKRAINKQFK